MDRGKQAGMLENVVGWYHSHPGYGCWLSGIDVATERQNQQLQDPFVAVVVRRVPSINSICPYVSKLDRSSKDHFRGES